jgi:hyperosmotically inducible protein
MKKNILLVISLVLVTLAFSSVSCVTTRTGESAGQYVDDSVITTKVKSLLAEDDLLVAFQVSVETFKGVVQLSGFADSQAAVDEAGRIARGVTGVSSVENNLIVK